MSRDNRHTPPPPLDEKKEITITSAISRSSSTSSSSGKLSQRSPRTARFAEATSVNSPIDPPSKGRNPFAGAPIQTHYLRPQPQVADVGFGYMAGDEIKQTTVEVPMTPRTPMRSALKVPNTPGRFIDPRSPTFKEEVKVEEEDLKTEKQNAKDVAVKKRVQIAKFFLRSVNFGCSLIVLSMLSTTFTIFSATKSLPPRGGLPAWANGQQTWPQITLLCISCVSLVTCVIIFWGYWKGGHRKAKKTAVYYTAFALCFFVFSTVMWIVAAVMLHYSRANGNGQDMWGWACNQNKRATLFQDTVNYALVCRLQNWGLVCALIEVVVELITISLYSIVGYRIWSKRKLHKSMNVRDKARSDLYLAQLRSQSAPNTPGVAKSASFGAFPDDAAERGYAAPFDSTAEAEEEAAYAARHQSFSQPLSSKASGGASSFHLQAPPAVRVQEPTPKIEQTGFQSEEAVHQHMDAAPGEQQYDAVPIPGAYSDATSGVGPVHYE